MRFWLLVAVFGVATCKFDPSLSEDAKISCERNADCPGDLRCIPDVGLCTTRSGDDSTPPQVALVSLSPGAGTTGTEFTLTFSIDEPLLVDPVVLSVLGSFEGAWTRASDTDYTYTFQAVGVPDGTLSVEVKATDLSGNVADVTLGSIEVDTTGPSIQLLGLEVLSNTPGNADVVQGVASATEASAIVTLYSDAGLLNAIDTTTAAGDGSFTALSMGDNFTDETAGGLTGQDLYWLQAVDSFGNTGDAVPVVTDIVAPTVEVLSIERLLTEDPEAWTPSTVFSAMGIESGRVRIRVIGQIGALPRLQIDNSGTGVFDVPCGLETVDATGAIYQCLFEPTGTEPEAADLTSLAFVPSFGSGNVGAAVPGVLRLDFTAPEIPDLNFINVLMNTTGVSDGLEVLAGAVEPNATVEVFTRQDFITRSGPGCAYISQSVAVTDATGAVTFDIGDNTFSRAFVQQIDAAGNPACGPCVIGFDCSAAAIIANDSVAPTVSVSTSVTDVTADSDATFDFTVTEAGPNDAFGFPVLNPPTTFYCALDGAPESTCSTSFTLTGLTAGGHILEYRAEDALGNMSTLRSVTWQILPNAVAFNGASYISYGPLQGVATPPTLVIAEGSNLFTTELSAGTWTVADTLRTDLSNEGTTLTAVQGATDTWVTHLAGSYPYTVMIEQYDGSTNTTHGPIVGNADWGTPQIALLPDGNPVVVYLQRTASTQIAATWWDGTQFVSTTSVYSVSDNQIQTLALIGDHNGATAGGETWVFAGDTANSLVRVIKFTATGEDPGVAGCETCSDEVVTTGTPQPNVSAGFDPTGKPQVLVADWNGQLYLMTYDSTWQTRDLRTELEAQLFNLSTSSWQLTNCFPSTARPRSGFAFDYDASGYLRLHGLMTCFRWSSSAVQVMALENATGFPIYPIAAGGTTLTTSVPGIWARSTDTIAAWGAPSDGDVLSFDSDDL